MVNQVDNRDPMTAYLEDVVYARVVKPKKADAKLQTKEQPVDVELGSTNIHLTRRRVPEHLKFIKKDPEALALGEKRTDRDLRIDLRQTS